MSTRETIYRSGGEELRSASIHVFRDTTVGPEFWIEVRTPWTQLLMPAPLSLVKLILQEKQ